MKFNDTTSKDGLVQDVWFNCFGDSLDHSGEYPLADITRNINQHYYKVSVLFWQNSPIWSWDDRNYTTHSIATTDLVDNQADYQLENNLLAIERVAVKDSGGNWNDLIEANFDELNDVDRLWLIPAGLPRRCALRGTSLWLFPKVRAADVTTTGGLKIYFSRLADPFVSTDTTKEPGFNPAYHRLLSLGASIDYLVVNNPSRYQVVKLEYRELLNDFIGWLKARQKTDRKVALSPHRENYE